MHLYPMGRRGARQSPAERSQSKIKARFYFTLAQLDFAALRGKIPRRPRAEQSVFCFSSPQEYSAFQHPKAITYTYLPRTCYKLFCLKNCDKSQLKFFHSISVMHIIFKRHFLRHSVITAGNVPSLFYHIRHNTVNLSVDGCFILC